MTNKLNPTVVKNHEQAMDVALDGVRRRPIVAINDEGELVVCCRATARLKGWEVQGSLHTRPQTGTPAPSKHEAAATPKRRAHDREGVVVMSAKKVANVKAAISAAAATMGLEDILGK